MKKNISLACLLMTVVGLMTQTLMAAETFAPLKDGKAPQSVEELWADFDPRAEPLDVEVLKEWEEDGVVMQVLRYRIGIFKGKKSMMAAVYGYPKGASNLPGLVQAHGGGQYADYRAVFTNAKRGYVTLSIAWAGRINAPDYKVDRDGVKLFTDQATDDPDYKLTTDWGALDGYHAPARYGASSMGVKAASYTLDEVESPRNCCYFLWPLAARRGLTFLEQQPQVDGERLGIYGHSMGAKITVLTAGIDKRVKAAAPSCGGISNKTENELYQKTIADACYLDQLTCPIIFLSPANDFHGNLIDVPKAIELIQTDRWRVATSAHGSHQDLGEFEVGGLLWFDQHLKGSFKYPATPEVQMTLKTSSGTPSFTVRPDASKKIDAVDVYYTQDGEPLEREHRKNRFWHYAKTVRSGDQWTADLPVATTDKPLWAYANIRYRLDEPVTGAGYYYRVYTTDVFNASSPVQIASAEDLVAADVKPTLEPSLLIEDFQGDWEKEWFVYRQDTWDKQDSWERMTHKVYCDLWKAPEGAKLALDVRSQTSQTLVVGLDSNTAEVELTGDGQWQAVVLSPADFGNGSGRGQRGLANWRGIKLLKLAPKRTGNPRPEFRNLRWVVGETQQPKESKVSEETKVFNIKDYGAVGDGTATETEAVQKAIDACHAAGGGTVWVPAGDYVIGTIILKSNIALSLDYGASLLGSLNRADYATNLPKPREGWADCLIFAENAVNITIEGLGVIDGRGTREAFPWKQRFNPRLMRMENCEQLKFSGVTYKRPAFWGIHLVDCRDIHFDTVTIYSRNNNLGNDGIDLDGCENVLVENCDINSGDDAVCLKSSLNPCRNIVVRNCKISSHTAPLKFGASSHGGFIDIQVTNCYFYDSQLGAIKLELVDGGRMENVEISRIVMEDVGNPIFIRLGNRGKTYGKGGKAPVGSIKNIRISDVVAKVIVHDEDKSGDYSDKEKAKAGPIMITGIPGYFVEDVVLEDVKISYQGYGSEEEAKNIVPEDEERYPEQYFFGVLPAWGAYIRHARNVEFKNVELTLRDSDARQKIVLDDVESFENH